MQACANDFWAVLRDYAAPPPAAVLTQQVRVPVRRLRVGIQSMRFDWARVCDVRSQTYFGPNAAAHAASACTGSI